MHALDIQWLINRINAGTPTTLLFVCSSNYIRSPFAEFYLKRAVSTLPPVKSAFLKITSGATIFDREKDGMHPIERQILVQQYGFSRAEVDAHVPKYVKRADHRHLLGEADAIIGFERVQLKTLPKSERHKAVMLVEFVTGEPREIPDPFFDASTEVLSKTFADIRQLLDVVMNALRAAGAS